MPLIVSRQWSNGQSSEPWREFQTKQTSVSNANDVLDESITRRLDELALHCQSRPLLNESGNVHLFTEVLPTTTTGRTSPVVQVVYCVVTKSLCCALAALNVPPCETAAMGETFRRCRDALLSYLHDGFDLSRRQLLITALADAQTKSLREWHNPSPRHSIAFFSPDAMLGEGAANVDYAVLGHSFAYEAIRIILSILFCDGRVVIVDRSPSVASGCLVCLLALLSPFRLPSRHPAQYHTTPDGVMASLASGVGPQLLATAAEYVPRLMIGSMKGECGTASVTWVADCRTGMVARLSPPAAVQPVAAFPLLPHLDRVRDVWRRLVPPSQRLEYQQRPLRTQDALPPPWNKAVNDDCALAFEGAFCSVFGGYRRDWEGRVGAGTCTATTIDLRRVIEKREGEVPTEYERNWALMANCGALWKQFVSEIIALEASASLLTKAVQGAVDPLEMERQLGAQCTTAPTAALFLRAVKRHAALFAAELSQSGRKKNDGGFFASLKDIAKEAVKKVAPTTSGLTVDAQWIHCACINTFPEGGLKLSPTPPAGHRIPLDMIHRFADYHCLLRPSTSTSSAVSQLAPKEEVVDKGALPGRLASPANRLPPSMVQPQREQQQHVTATEPAFTNRGASPSPQSISPRSTTPPPPPSASSRTPTADFMDSLFGAAAPPPPPATTSTLVTPTTTQSPSTSADPWEKLFM